MSAADDAIHVHERCPCAQCRAIAARDARIAELEARTIRAEVQAETIAQLTRELAEARADTAEVIAMGESNAAKSYAAGFAACREMVANLCDGDYMGSDGEWHSAETEISRTIRALTPQGGDDGEVG